MSTDAVRVRSLALYIAIVCAIGATVAGLVTAATVTGPGTISWPVIALGFAATELGVIHLRLGRNAFSFTLHEGVLVAAAVSATPRDTMIGLLIGTAVVMAGVQRMSPAKVAFNLGQYLLSAAVVVSVLGPLGPDSVETPAGWALAFAVTAAVSVGTMTLIAFAIRLAQGLSVLATVKRSFVSSLGITFVSTAIGLAVASVAVIEPVRLALLVPLVAVFALGVRSHHQLLVRSDQLELVHGTVRLMAEATELEPALEVLVGRACATLTAERAAIVLRARDGSFRQVIVDPEGTRWESSNEQFVTALETATRAGRGAATIDSGSDLFGEIFAITEVDGPARALLAELRVGERVHGVIAVVQGRGITNAGPEELELLRSLALHAAVVLEATQLATAHANLRERTRIRSAAGTPDRAGDRRGDRSVARHRPGTECAAVRQSERLRVGERPARVRSGRPVARRRGRPPAQPRPARGRDRPGRW